MMKSSIESANASSAAERIAGKMTGIVTSQKAWIGLEPRSRAASLSEGSMSRSRACRTMTTKATLKATWAIRIVPKPRLTPR